MIYLVICAPIMFNKNNYTSLLQRHLFSFLGDDGTTHYNISSVAKNNYPNNPINSREAVSLRYMSQ